MKRIFKWAALLFLFFIIYEIAGALFPFVQEKKPGPNFIQAFDPKAFYQKDGDAKGPDRARVVETSMDALDTRIQMIHQAKKRIILSTFDIRDGGSCQDIFSSLLEAADRGVQVQVLVDGLYGSLHMDGNPMFYVLGTHPNVEIKFYNIPSLAKPWTINGRMHDKYVIIDDKLLLLGGRNTFDYFLGNYNLKDASYDRDVLVYNTRAGQDPENTSPGNGGTNPGSTSAIYQAISYFQNIWASKDCQTVFRHPSKKMEAKLPAARKMLKAHYQRLAASRTQLTNPNIDFTASTVPIQKATLIYNPIHIYGKEPWVWYQLQYLMAHSKNRVVIQTPYAVFSKDMYQGIAQIAKQVSGATMMVNATSVGDNFVASSDYTRNRGKILATGIQLQEYFGNQSSHGKSILIGNDLSVIGSYNLDMRSTYVDTETMLVIQGKEFNQQLEGYIKQLEDQSLVVKPDGSYVPKENVPILPVPPVKKAIFAVTSRLFQLFRYLI